MSKLISKYDWLLVMVLFLISELIINPFGEFPLNDDWAYSNAIDNYIKSAHIQFSIWQGFPDLPRFFIGVLLCKWFGFSLSLLKLTTVIYFLASLFVFYKILSAINIKSEFRFPALLLFTFNPLSITLTNSYLSDMFQLLLTLLTFYIALLYLQKDKLKFALAYLLTAVIAVLSRQIALVVPAILFVLVFFTLRESKSKTIFFLISFLVTIATLLGYECLAKQWEILPGNYYLQIQAIYQSFKNPSVHLMKTLGYNFITSTICLGIFILPFTISKFKKAIRMVKENRFELILFTCYILSILYKVFYTNNVLPFVGNIFYHLGVGPIIMNGFNTDEPTKLSLLASVIWILLNLAGGISFFVSSYYILNKIKQNVSEKSYLINYFYSGLILFYLIPLCFNYANDRYLLILFPFYFIAYCHSVDTISPKLFYVSLVPLFYFSIALNYNYIQINKARQTAETHLLQELKIKPEEIDGGFEFNGRYLSQQHVNYNPHHTGQWWWVHDNKFVISPRQLNGYSVESEYKVNNLPPIQINSIFVLRRVN